MPTLPVLTPQQAASWDARAGACGIPPRALMESAGRAVATIIATRFGERLRQGVLVACGPGNNGGDGRGAGPAPDAPGAPAGVVAGRGGGGRAGRGPGGARRGGGGVGGVERRGDGRAPPRDGLARSRVGRPRG